MVVGHLERRRAEVEKRLAEVEECCKLASKNSSKPPSSDPPAGRDPLPSRRKAASGGAGRPVIAALAFSSIRPSTAQK